MKNALYVVLAVLLSAVAANGEQSCKSTVVGDLRIEHFQSKTYNNAVTLRVWLPPGYSNSSESARKYPTLYILDGQTAFDECTAFHGEHELQIDETVTKLISEHKIPPIIVVGIDSSAHRNYEYSPYADSITDAHAPEPIGKQLPSFIADEVLPSSRLVIASMVILRIQELVELPWGRQQHSMPRSIAQTFSGSH
jgi:enterochelin esterase-like enzyme